MKFSIIIADYNDHDICHNLLNSLLDTDLVGCEDKYEIIVVNDGSDDIFLISEDNAAARNIKVLNRNINLGVGDAFDWGVSVAKGEYIILMGADVYVGRKGWVAEAIKSFNESMYAGMGIMCFANIAHSGEDIDQEGTVRYGANMIWKMDGTELSFGHRHRGDVTYRDILQGKWNLEYPSGGVGRVACLMGAMYLTTRSYYQRIRGFNGHRVWGGLEPMISLKTWLSGGEILINAEIANHHTFTRKGRLSDLQNYYANKIFIAQSTLKSYQARNLINYFCNITARKEALKHSYSYLYQHRDLINYLGGMLCYDVRDIEILNWE